MRLRNAVVLTTREGARRAARPRERALGRVAQVARQGRPTTAPNFSTTIAPAAGGCARSSTPSSPAPRTTPGTPSLQPTDHRGSTVTTRRAEQPGGRIGSVRQVAVPGRRLRGAAGSTPADGVPDGRRPAGAAAARGPADVALLGAADARSSAGTASCSRRTCPASGSPRCAARTTCPSVAASLIALLAAELDVVRRTRSRASRSPSATRRTGRGRRRAPIGGSTSSGTTGAARSRWPSAAARPDLVRRVVVISAPYRKVDLTRAWHIPVLGFVPPAVFARRRPRPGPRRCSATRGRPAAHRQALVEGYADAYAAPNACGAMVGYYRARGAPVGSGRTASRTRDGCRPNRRHGPSAVWWSGGPTTRPCRSGSVKPW